MVYQSHNSRCFRVRRGVLQGSVLGHVLFSLFINDLPASLPSSVSCSLYTDDLAICSSSPLVPTAVEATQGALFRLKRWSEYWCLPLSPRKCEASFFSVDPHQANLQPNLLLLGSCLRFNPSPTFLGVTFDHTLFFSEGGTMRGERVKVRLSPTLTLSPLMVWYSGLTALFLFLLEKAATAFLPSALSVELRPLFPFQQQFVQVFPLKPAPFCTLFAGLGSTTKFAISLLFSSCLTLVLSSPPSFLLSQTLWQIWQELSSHSCCSIRLLWVPGHSFLQGMTRPMSWPDGVCHLPPPQSLVVSLLLFLVSTLDFSWTGGVLSHRSILTHRFPRYPLRNLCSLVMLTVSSLVFDAMDTAFF